MSEEIKKMKLKRRVPTLGEHASSLAPGALDPEEKLKSLGEACKPERAWYTTTANPQNKVNIDLHRMRYRKEASFKAKSEQSGGGGHAEEDGKNRAHHPQEEAGKAGEEAKQKEAESQGPRQAEKHKEEERKRFEELYGRMDWGKTHRHLDDIKASKFFMDWTAQKLIYAVQVGLVDEAYDRFGKKEGSWERYTLMFRNGYNNPGDARKPVTSEFQEYCEEVYCPIMWALLFGEGWPALRPHWSAFKSCTIKVCDSGTTFLGKNVFHMHIDGKIGLLQRRNHAQKHMSRLLFSIVTDALNDQENKSLKRHCTTVYPIWQPPFAFKSNHHFHEYMQTYYRECGLENSGLPRPHYEMPENLIYRAQTGEVLLHHTHGDKQRGPQAIHSEPNPCPDRHLFVFDWNNLLRKDPNNRNKYLPSTEVPEEAIIAHMRPLENASAPAFLARLRVVLKTARDLLPKAAEYPGGREAVAAVVKTLEEAAASALSSSSPSVMSSSPSVFPGGEKKGSC